MNSEAIAEIAEILNLSIEDAEQIAPLLKQRFGNENTDAPKEQKEVAMSDEQTTAKPSKIKCKVCGFYKKPRKVLRETGCCAVCTEAISDGSAETVEVVGRQGKRGRNSVSVVIDGRRFKVKRLSNRHSENVAKRYMGKGKGYAKKSSGGSQPPKGLPTSSRLPGDAR